MSQMNSAVSEGISRPAPFEPELDAAAAYKQTGDLRKMIEIMRTCMLYTLAAGHWHRDGFTYFTYIWALHKALEMCLQERVKRDFCKV